MKKPLVTMLLILATAAVQPLVAQQSSPAAGQTAGSAPAGQPQQQKKEIKDPAEYNAYVNATQQSDPNQKATALESFLQTYPNSVMKIDAMELLMAAYQQAGNAQKTVDAANRILQVDPNNVRALALLAYNARAQAESNHPEAIPQAAEFGNKGLQALASYQKPEGVSDADFAKQKAQLEAIFAGAAGFAALQQKDYATASKDLTQAIAAEDSMKMPESPQSNAMMLRDMYPLAVADLEQKPMNPEGLWYAARAVKLANGNAAAQAAIEKYGKAKYTKYHGSDQAWSDLEASATSNVPPAGFTVAPAPPPPTPQQQAQDLVNSKAVKDMSFAEWQLILSSGNDTAASKVWDTIHDKQVALVAYVISATRTKIELAGSTDDNDAHKADITLTLDAPIPVSKVPKEGTTLEFQGAPDTYTPNPFMMNMKEGSIPSLEKAAPVHHTAPAHKKPAAQ
ncbi:MAG TPA: hypothetical protein VGL89_00255 [Candidatus Koribacter sp.]|jgi:hypothetical protein